MLKVWRPVASETTWSSDRSCAIASWLSAASTCFRTAVLSVSGLTAVFTTQVTGMILLLSSMKLSFTCARGMYISSGAGFPEAGFLHIADDAHYLARQLGKVGSHALAYFDLLVDGVSPWPVFLRKGFVDDDDGRRACGVTLVEQPAAPQWDLQHLEVGVETYIQPAPPVDCSP